MKFLRFRSYFYENQDDIKRYIGNNRQCDHMFDCDDHPDDKICQRCCCTNIISDTGQRIMWSACTFSDYCKDHINLCFNCRSPKIEIYDEIGKVDYCNECWQNKIQTKSITKEN